MITVHETVHQWFGNMLTCKWSHSPSLPSPASLVLLPFMKGGDVGRWDDIWLNEGLTNFVACGVAEELRGAGWRLPGRTACFAQWRRHALGQASGDLALSDHRNYPKFQVFTFFQLIVHFN